MTDAFTGGGAQADRLTTEFHTSITWLVIQTIGRYTLKYGFNIPDWSRRGLRDGTNRLGTLICVAVRLCGGPAVCCSSAAGQLESDLH
ncbi:MAG: hypothetical protein ACREUU_18310 [Gammaproteobacteria bacterium]